MITGKDLKLASDKNVVDSKDVLLESVTAQLRDKYASQGRYEGEVLIAPQQLKGLGSLLKKQNIVAVNAGTDKSKKVKVLCYWGPGANKVLGDKRSQQQWLKDQLAQGRKRFS